MRYAVGVFIFIILAIFVIVLLLTRSPSPDQRGKKKVGLVEYADKDARADYTIDGPVVANEVHYSIHMTVSRTERVIEILQGYDGVVARREVFPNNEPAYSTFIHALDNAGYSRQKNYVIKSEQGVCPLGSRYIYELNDGTEQVFRNWSTTCATNQGTFGGNATIIRQLFQKQFPNYRDLTKGISLSAS